tara:strand:- start:1633 stop:2094 length:462 start_codon:yes stop_codon:yes gene_type:complete
MNRKDILDLDLRKIFNPRIWLIIVAVPHTLFGALVPLFQSEIGSTDFSGATYGLLNTIILVSIYLLIEDDKTLSRMTAVVATSVFFWIIAMLTINEGDGFELSAQLTPPFIYKFSFSIELAPPLILWGFLALSGILHWNGPLDNDGQIEPIVN